MDKIIWYRKKAVFLLYIVFDSWDIYHPNFYDISLLSRHIYHLDIDSIL